MKMRPRTTRRIGRMAAAAVLLLGLMGVAVWERGAAPLQAAQDVPVDANSISGVVRNGGYAGSGGVGDR